MKLFKYLLAIFFVLNLNSLNAQEDSLQSKITKNLRCLICQGQSVYDSDSEFADSIKILVKTFIFLNKVSRKWRSGRGSNPRPSA